jgi:lipoprotein-anchoring transpeptidase ErfK/SrfK
VKKTPVLIVFGALLIVILGLLLWKQFSTVTVRTQSPTTLVASSTTPLRDSEVKPTLYKYFEIVDGCGPYYQGTCVNMRSGPGVEYPVILRLRTGMVMKIASEVKNSDGTLWYKIAQDASIRYPDRITSEWYVLAGAVQEFNDDGDHRIAKNQKFTTTKRITVDLTHEMLYAYDGDTLFMQEPISTGLDYTPTPIGTFTVYAMTPSRYMQGPLPNVSSQKYDLPGVPWNLYFTQGGDVIHGAYWHNHFGEPWSHGCVNLSPENAKKLYQWAELGMSVSVVQ